MKNIQHLFCFFLFSVSFSLLAQPNDKKTITVSTAEQFINAINSNVSIKLTTDTFRLRDIMKLIEADLEFEGEIQLTKNVWYIAGNGIAISGIKNFEIIGLDSKKKPVLAMRDQGDIVLTFRKCSDFRLENFEANHLPRTHGACQGGVLFFDECENVAINNVVLIGSGNFGIQCNNVKKLTCENSTVLECSSSLFQLNYSSDLLFNSCVFSKIKCTGLIGVTDCQSVRFINCTFDSNYSDTNSGYYSVDNDFVFHFYDDKISRNFELLRCVFSNNKIKAFSDKSSIFTRSKCTYVNNDGLK